MFTDQLTRAIAAARTGELDHLSREIWRAHGSGIIDDAVASAALEALAARKTQTRPSPSAAAKVSPMGSARRRQRSPDRQASIERRRHLAASGPMPPALAARFTVGELAALRIIGDEVRHHGVCALHIDAIAARAGVCRTVVKNALREARRLGMVTVQERRRRGQRSLTNVIHIISSEWLTWLRRGAGVRKSTTTDIKTETQTETRGFGGNWGRYYRHYDPGDKRYGRA
jgi:hypothetical protein